MHVNEPSARFTERISTGDRGLDLILGGGLFRGSVSIIQGSPGAGKTVLANQMAFRHLEHGGRVLYVTLLSESHGRLMSHMQGMDFFLPAEVAKSIHYLSGYAALTQEGVRGVMHLIGTEAKARNASLVVLDGLFVIEDTCRQEGDFRRFVNDLGVQAEMMGCTILLLTNSKRMSSSPEYTMVDAWIELGRQPVSYRTVRYLEVHKLRGSDFYPGRHALTISHEGLKVLPRLEAALGHNPDLDEEDSRLSTGMPDLDALIGGGFSCASATLVLGPTGIGKTSMGLQFLSLATPDEPGLIFGFYETKRQLVRKARDRGIDLKALMATGAVDVVWHPPTENRLDVLGYELLEHVRERNVRRLFVDSINAFEQSAVYPERLGRFLSALVNELKGMSCTSMFTSETHELLETHGASGFFSPIAENILLMRYAEVSSALVRTLAMVKVRDSEFDHRVRHFAITPEGVKIGGVFERDAVRQAGFADSKESTG